MICAVPMAAIGDSPGRPSRPPGTGAPPRRPNNPPEDPNSPSKDPNQSVARYRAALLREGALS